MNKKKQYPIEVSPIVIRFNKSLKDRLQKAASLNGQTVNGFLKEKIENILKEEK